MIAFLDSLDIANRACQRVGCSRILTVDEDSKANNELTFVYDKLRRAELRRNFWVFSIRRAVLRPIDTTTMLLDPAVWDATVTYAPGAIVKDENGSLWQSMMTENINNEPGSTVAWDGYFGPMTVHLYDAETTYYAGELVYAPAGNPGGYVVFTSLINGNEDDPEVGDAWVTTTTYNYGDVVTYGGYNWRSLIELNQGITPAVAPLDWDSTAVYAAAETVVASDGYIYTSVAGSNTGFDPVTDAGVHWTNSNLPAAWTRTPTVYTAATNWRPLFAAIRRIDIQYPVGAGPLSQSNTRSVFRKPNGYLRTAPEMGKQGSHSSLGAPSGLDYNDWEMEGDYIISSETTAILVRFVADLVDVSKMDDMFCEGLACRMGFETCEAITQSSSKQQTIGAAYLRFMTEARLVNAIEVGPTEPPEDDFITCRI